MTAAATRTWWHKGRRLSTAEHVLDIVVHGIGLAVAAVAGGALLVIAALNSVSGDFLPLSVYVGSLVLLLTASLLFNLWPRTALKRVWARLDQAAIFLFIAGTYTPFLALMAEAPGNDILAVTIWGAAVVGIALKLIVPARFGRLAILLYLAIGWSGVVAFQALAATLPIGTIWLLVAGGVVYTAGILFLFWERLKFQTVLWHAFVVVGACLHLIAIYDMVLRAA